MDAPQVTVETHLPGGLPGFTLVGLPEAAVREARDRVRSAIQTCGLDFPSGRVVVNLAPADLAKEGGRFDLAIAISILAATGQVPHERVAAFEFLGELSLFGELQPVRGSLCAALALGTEGS
ncbi:MAG: magnesium chelatase domain-containing protein, partial [Gammaproteobacteria bacterium]